MNILICDDEEFFAIRIRDILQEHCLQEGLPATFTIVTEPKDMPSTQLVEFDIAFLDIDMQPMNGIEVGRALRRAKPDILILFVTNYIEYAPEGYEIQAFRYLVKNQLDQKLKGYFASALMRFRERRQIVSFRIEGEQIDVPVQNILYLESKTRMVAMHLTQMPRKEYQFYSTMAAMEQTLASMGFLRIHKSFLVNMAHLKRLQCDVATLANGEILSASEKFYPTTKERFLAWRGESKWNIS